MTCFQCYNIFIYLATSQGGNIMKIDRLIGILSILLQKDSVTAPELARQFEVSRRTINRDIDELCRAGIPVMTRQGLNGGISIMEGYRIDRTLLTGTELNDILAGLRSLDSVNGTNRYGQLMEKLSAGSSDLMTGGQSVLIDLSSWYKDSLAPKIEVIRKAIDTKAYLSFDYYSPSGESRRKVEPYYLIFRWSSWYVWGWCTERETYRLFKLNRMDHICAGSDSFIKRSAPLPNLRNEKIFPGGIKVKALFSPECFTETGSGELLFHADYTNKENLISWLLTFGSRVRLLEPPEIREEMRCIVKEMYENYR